MRISPRALYDKLYELAWLTKASRPYEESVRALPFTNITIFWPVEYAWSESGKWGDAILAALSRYATIERRPIAQTAETCISALIMVNEGAPIPITFDFSDYPHLNRDLVALGAPYFKLQLADTLDVPDNVYPGGYIPNSPMIYDLVGHLRARRRAHAPKFNVYGRFGTQHGYAKRAACIDRLKRSEHHMYGGFDPVRYSRFLREASQSRICIDLPGNGALCFRLVDMLALGCFIIAYPHDSVLPQPLVNGQHLVYMSRDMSDLPQLVEYYLHNKAERLRIAANAQHYFDSTLSECALGAYYLRTIFDWIESRTVAAPRRLQALRWSCA